MYISARDKYRSFDNNIRRHGGEEGSIGENNAQIGMDRTDV